MGLPYKGENLSSEKTCYNIPDNTTLTVANTYMQNPGKVFYGGSFQYDFQAFVI